MSQALSIFANFFGNFLPGDHRLSSCFHFSVSREPSWNSQELANFMTKTDGFCDIHGHFWTCPQQQEKCTPPFQIFRILEKKISRLVSLDSVSSQIFYRTHKKPSSPWRRGHHQQSKKRMCGVVLYIPLRTLC
jgi:hypothetical protein